MLLREKKLIQTKRYLFEAAMELFREKGYDAVNIESIAERAGFSRATFFNHFKSKESVLRYHGEQIQEKMEKLIANIQTENNPLNRVRLMIYTMAKYVEKNKNDLKMILFTSLRNPDYIMKPTIARKRVLKLLTDVLREAQQKKLIRQDISADQLTDFVFIMYQHITLAIIIKKISAEKAVQYTWQLILGGLYGHDSMA